jgi:hypothetical protein
MKICDKTGLEPTTTPDNTTAVGERGQALQHGRVRGLNNCGVSLGGDVRAG